MTEKQIEELDALEKKATPGPWLIDERGHKLGEKLIYGTDRISLMGDLYITDCRHDDLSFIAALRNAWPTLLSLLRRERERGK